MAVSVPTRRERQERTRSELLGAAARVFARRGYHAASVEEVAAEAGYTTGAVYSNFKSKEELFLALQEQELERRIEDYRAVGEAEASLRGLERAAAERFAKFIREDPEWPLLFFEFWAYGARREQLRERFREGRDRVRRVLAEGIERRSAEAGVELPLPAERLAVGISALVNGLAFERVIDPDRVTDELFGLLLSRLIVGLLAPVDEAA
jgi:AcrR family transcriptional regulator